jgi:hypothetical protein
MAFNLNRSVQLPHQTPSMHSTSTRHSPCIMQQHCNLACLVYELAVHARHVEELHGIMAPAKGPTYAVDSAALAVSCLPISHQGQHCMHNKGKPVGFHFEQSPQNNGSNSLADTLNGPTHVLIHQATGTCTKGLKQKAPPASYMHESTAMPSLSCNTCSGADAQHTSPA